MAFFCRFDLVLLVLLLGYPIKLNCLALSSGQKMLLITCSTSWMSFSQEIISSLLHMAEIDRHNHCMLDLCNKEVILSQQDLMVRNHLYILNGGMWCGSCNGTMLKGCFFLLSSLIGFLFNCRYCLCTQLFKLAPQIRNSFHTL